jgi:hypothetical protein
VLLLSVVVVVAFNLAVFEIPFQMIYLMFLIAFSSILAQAKYLLLLDIDILCILILITNFELVAIVKAELPTWSKPIKTSFIIIAHKHIFSNNASSYCNCTLATLNKVIISQILNL